MLYKLSGKIQGKEDEEIRFSCCLYEKEVYSDIVLYFRNRTMRLRKKILSLAIMILGIWGLWSFFGVSVASPVYAATGDTVSTTTTTMEDDFRRLADYFLKIAYVILWPLIMLSGLALDNTMVYGELFHMDAPLRQFWNLCKNFANFGLWFMILRSIIQNIFTFGNPKDFKPMETIKKAVIAGILIQMSWFLVAALIDISTIATYAVGGMPMSILNTETKTINTKILQPDVTINLNSEKLIEPKDFIISYQVKKTDGTSWMIPQCDVQQHQKQQYIIGRKYGDDKFRNQGELWLDEKQKPIDPGINACVYLWDVYFFYEFPDLVPLTGDAYKTKLTEILNYNERNGREACGYVIKLGENNRSKETCKDQSFLSVDLQRIAEEDAGLTWKDPLRYSNRPADTVTISTGAGKARFENSAATSIDQIIKKSKWFVGPLATIYTSMLDFANLTDSSNANGSMGKGIGELIIRTGVAAGLIFPLLALTIVLVIRIGFLRCIIAASPLIILAYIFKWNVLKDQIDPINILRAIFAPVITVFALSMGLIFMTALQSTYKTGGLESGLSSMGVSQKIWAAWDIYDTMNIFGVVLRYPKTMNTYAGATGDWFSWMLICFSGIGIMRFILFAAIKASGTIGEIGEKIKAFWENAISTAPIISLPGGGKAGIWTLFNNFSPTSDTARNNASAAWDNSEYVNIKGQNQTIKNALKKDEEERDLGKIKEYIGDRDYTAVTKVLTKDENASADTIVAAINGNQGFDTYLKSLDPAMKDQVLDGLKIKKEYYLNEATTEFDSSIGTVVDKAALEAKIKSAKWDKIAQLKKDYKKDITTEDGTTHTIGVDNGKLKITESKTNK